MITDFLGVLVLGICFSLLLYLMARKLAKVNGKGSRKNAYIMLILIVGIVAVFSLVVLRV